MNYKDHYPLYVYPTRVKRMRVYTFLNNNLLWFYTRYYPSVKAYLYRGMLSI